MMDVKDQEEGLSEKKIWRQPSLEALFYMQTSSGSNEGSIDGLGTYRSQS